MIEPSVWFSVTLNLPFIIIIFSGLRYMVAMLLTVMRSDGGFFPPLDSNNAELPSARRFISVDSVNKHFQISNHFGTKASHADMKCADRWTNRQSPMYRLVEQGLSLSALREWFLNFRHSRLRYYAGLFSGLLCVIHLSTWHHKCACPSQVSFLDANDEGSTLT